MTFHEYEFKGQHCTTLDLADDPEFSDFRVGQCFSDKNAEHGLVLMFGDNHKIVMTRDQVDVFRFTLNQLDLEYGKNDQL